MQVSCPCCSPLRSLPGVLHTGSIPSAHSLTNGLLPPLFGYAAADVSQPGNSSVAELRRRARAHLQALALECTAAVGSLGRLPSTIPPTTDVTSWLRRQSSSEDDMRP